MIARLTMHVQLSKYTVVWDIVVSTLLVPDKANSISWGAIGILQEVEPGLGEPTAH
jgi:hypothetical protein